MVLGLDQVYKAIQWSKERGPVFGVEELAISSDMRQASASELFWYTNTLPSTNETSLLRKKNVSLHAIEVLVTGGECKYNDTFFLLRNNLNFPDKGL